MYVKNIMMALDDMIVVYPETLIREAVEIMLSVGLIELAVVDKQGLFLGDINMRNIIREALPRYVSDGNLKDVSFTQGLPKFDDKLNDMMSKAVSSAMKRGVKTVLSEVSTFEVAAILSVAGNRDEVIYVVEKDGRLAGVVFISSLFRRLVTLKSI